MGYVSEKDYSFSEFAGAHFDEFAALSSKHCDGWGVTTIETGENLPTLVVEPAQASQSNKFAEVANNSKSNGALLHLRWATAGLSVKEGNTHPFTHGEISFIHNGGVIPSNAMDEFIDSDLFDQMRGDTDSERYFATIITEVRKHGLIDGITAAVRLIRERCDYSSLNAMILTPLQMIVVNEHNYKRTPPGETEEYYDLYYRTGAEGVMVASSGWNQDGWTLLANHRLLVIDRKASHSRN